MILCYMTLFLLRLANVFQTDKRMRLSEKLLFCCWVWAYQLLDFKKKHQRFTFVCLSPFLQNLWEPRSLYLHMEFLQRSPCYLPQLLQHHFVPWQRSGQCAEGEEPNTVFIQLHGSGKCSSLKSVMLILIT